MIVDGTPAPTEPYLKAGIHHRRWNNIQFAVFADGGGSPWSDLNYAGRLMYAQLPSASGIGKCWKIGENASKTRPDWTVQAEVVGPTPKLRLMECDRTRLEEDAFAQALRKNAECAIFEALVATGVSHGLYTKTLKRDAELGYELPEQKPRLFPWIPRNTEKDRTEETKTAVVPAGPHPTSESALYAILRALCEPFEESGVRQPVCRLPAARRGLHRAFPLSPDADERVAAQRRRDVVRQLERRMLRRGVFTSVTDLRETIRAFIDSHNTHAAKLFRWIKSAQTMLGAVIPAHEPYAQKFRARDTEREYQKQERDYSEVGADVGAASTSGDEDSGSSPESARDCASETGTGSTDGTAAGNRWPAPTSVAKAATRSGVSRSASASSGAKSRTSAAGLSTSSSSHAMNRARCSGASNHCRSRERSQVPASAARAFLRLASSLPSTASCSSICRCASASLSLARTSRWRLREKRRNFWMIFLVMLKT